MTPKQEETVRNKIKKIKAALAADKKRWGGFHHDGQGLRFAPPRLYIQIADFSGGLRYLNWFKKAFPADSGFPDFLFEWTIILFKTGRLKEAEKKAFQTYTGNTYLFDKFFGRPLNKIDKWEGIFWETVEFATDNFSYSCHQKNLTDFAEWLNRLTQTEKFAALMNKYVEIHIKLNNEDDREIWSQLVTEAGQLENEM